jgi:hypothetical protein
MTLCKLLFERELDRVGVCTNPKNASNSFGKQRKRVSMLTGKDLIKPVCSTHRTGTIPLALSMSAPWQSNLSKII